MTRKVSPNFFSPFFLHFFQCSLSQFPFNFLYHLVLFYVLSFSFHPEFALLRLLRCLEHFLELNFWVLFRNFLYFFTSIALFQYRDRQFSNVLDCWPVGPSVNLLCFYVSVCLICNFFQSSLKFYILLWLKKKKTYDSYDSNI